MELDAKDQSDFEQYALKLSNAYVIDGAGAEFAEEFFRPQGAKVVDDERPQMEDVVPGHTIPFLYYDNLGSQQLRLYRRTKAAWPPSDDQHLKSISRVRRNFETSSRDIFLREEC